MRVLNVAMLSCLTAIAIAGCSSDGYHSNNKGTQSNSGEYSQNNSYMTDTTAGSVMTTPQGMTVYTFDKDQPGVSNCYGECATHWPPVMAGHDAQPYGHMTLVTRSDGQRQWAYDGKPLYTYQDDMVRGDIKGDNVGSVWHVVK